MSTIDLSAVKNVIARVSTLVDELDGVVADDYQHGVKKAELAALTRKLLIAADGLELGAGLIRNQYWQTKSEDVDMLERR